MVADDPLARAGLVGQQRGQPGCTVVGQVPVGAQLSSLMEVYGPEVVMWDLGWDPTSSLESLSELSDAGTPIIALLPEESHASEVWASGARGLLPRNAETESLMAALIAVAQGLIILDPRLAPSVPPPAGPRPAPPVGELTPRELEVLRLLAEGLPNKSIGQRLGISEHTVKFHVNSILGKLGAQSRTEAVTLASRLGLILL